MSEYTETLLSTSRALLHTARKKGEQHVSA